MLPYLEAANNQAMFNPLANADAPDPVWPGVNNAARAQVINVLLCPSDTNVIPMAGFGIHNYALNTGTTFSVSTLNPSNVPVTGIFFENSRITTADIRDGSSQTICISETTISVAGMGGQNAGPYVQWDGTPTRGFILTTGNDNAWNAPELTNYAAQCVPGNTLEQGRGCKWFFGAPGHAMYNHIRGPNDPGIDCRGGNAMSNFGPSVWNLLSQNVTCHSNHPGGVSSLYCDGHVQFVTDGIALPVWWGLGSRNLSDAANPN